MLSSLVSLDNISFILVFCEGILSFLSPCIVPIIPIYMSYLAGSARMVHEDGTVSFQQKKVFVQTLFFIFGICSTLFLLGMTFTSLGSFFHKYKILFRSIGAILIILLGLFQLGILKLKFLHKEKKFSLRQNHKINPFVAFLMGFTFSFSWTPCVGPMLSSVLILASSAQTKTIGNILVLLYAIGFVIPFLLLGIFTTQTLNFLKKRQNIIQYTVKIGGALLLLIGLITLTGWVNHISRYLASSDSKVISSTDNISSDVTIQEDEDNSARSNANDNENASPVEKPKYPAYDFNLTDQYGNSHHLSDYKGKVVFLNFWATWCGPCLSEIADIEALYQDYGLNQEDVVILGILNPSTEEQSNIDITIEEAKTFLEENKLTFPTLMDTTGEILISYRISAFPTTYLIDAEGNLFGYAVGSLRKEMMEAYIEKAKNSSN